MKGICFKEELFHATIEGRKTQTRRIMEPQPDYVNERNEPLLTCATFPHACQPTLIKPRYKVGDIVYLKEPYYDCQNCEGLYYDLYKYAGGELPYTTSKWRNKLFMPADKARYFIKITTVRAERLQDISDEDCLREGIYKHIDGVYEAADSLPMGATPRNAYAALIDKINGKGTWESNPWVWVYDYELCESVKP